MKKIVRLRAHHGMCLAFFEGKEYHKNRQKRENLRRLQRTSKARSRAQMLQML